MAKKSTAWIAGAAIGLILAAGSTAQGAEPINLQLKWEPQAQFGGYYAALEQGYYRDEGLEVTILSGGPDASPTQALADGLADVAVEWMPAALVARERGLSIVNIAQPFQNSGMVLTCRKDAGVTNPATDLAGKIVGTWFAGNEFGLQAWLGRMGMTMGDDPGAVTLLHQRRSVEPLIQHQAACISAMTYNEYPQLLASGLTPDDLTSFVPSDGAVLEDGLYVLQTALDDKAMQDRLARFVRASMKGWRYAEAHPAEMAQIVTDHANLLDETANADSNETRQAALQHQTHMAVEVAKLTAGSNGALDEAAYQRTVDLLSAGANPVLHRAPSGAFTHEITNKAMAPTE